MSSLLNTWYQEGAEIPPEIFVSVEPPDAEPLSEVLCERAGHAVKIAMPQRGSKRRLIELAIQNAGALFAQERARADRTTRGLEELAEVCRLPKYPKRIESFDNSNIQGTDPVAAMVVFTDGRPDRAEYRRYRVKTVEGADDFATMKEILGRRFARALEDGVFPDLLLIDGGKGQVNAVLAALGELGIKDQPVIGIAKPKTEKRRGERDAVDKIVVPGQKNDIVLRHNSPALQLVQAIRDETHRTAVGYHRKVRTRRNLTSEATTIPGVGPVRTKRLLTHFGSMAALRVASVEEIAAVKGIGPRVAKIVVDTLHAPEEPAES
jgi:excinuclease ABC subunit C